MAKSEIIAGVDIGSSQIVCVIARRNTLNHNAIEVLGSGRKFCRGLKGGVVININETAQSITQAVEEAEDAAKESVNEIYLAIRGNHIQSFNHHGAINIARTDKEIMSEDVTMVIDAAKAVPISQDREIIHIIPQDFSLDRQRGVPNPIGMEGTLLEVDVHMVTASGTHLNNIWKSVNRAGFTVVEPIDGLLAVGEIVVSEEEKELGSLLIDFGGQTIGIGVYSDGSIHFSKEIPIGSDFISKDISYGLRTSMATAQTIKERYGAAMLSLINDDEEIEFTSVDGKTTHHVQRQTVVEIIQPRIEEIFSLISEEVQNSGFADIVIPGGVILTGGGSLLPGMTNAAEQIIGMPTRLGRPQNITSPEDIASNPIYATAIGTLMFPWVSEWKKSMNKVSKGGMVKKVKGWFEGIF
ncbi:MAG: cell division protein FtsA [bacterium]